MSEEKRELETAEQINNRLKSARFPFNQFLGVRVVETADDGLTMETEVRAEWGNVFGSMHGGVTASLVDTAVGIAVIRGYGFGRPVTTVELKVSYLRPIHAGRVTVKARILKQGKTLSVGIGDVFDQEGVQCATSLVTYMAL